MSFKKLTAYPIDLPSAKISTWSIRLQRLNAQREIPPVTRLMASSGRSMAPTTSPPGGERVGATGNARPASNGNETAEEYRTALASNDTAGA